MKKVMIIAIALLATIGVVNSSYAQAPGVVTSNSAGWHKIGEVKASFKMENESISVLGADRFKSIKLKVTDAPINIENIRVFYESGESEEINVRSELKAGAETRVIDLKGNTQELKKIVFTYKTLPNVKEDKAHVELYGLK
ncbi:MAG TPA: hypothetical protein VIT44_13160 [Cyclobacteriaceae bacterium]